jgi:adenine specific DNA methylase Mod
MPKRLDYRLQQVSELRQVGISTARAWRDGGNEKWFKALEEVEIENEKRKKKNQQLLGSLY